MVAAASFSALKTENGNLRFYATANAANIYNKRIIGYEFSSASGICDTTTDISYNSASADVSVSTFLCNNPPCPNPCPNTLAVMKFIFLFFTFYY